MAAPVPVIVCIYQDGQWYFETVQVIGLVCVAPTPAVGQSAVASCRKKPKRAKRAPPARCPSSEKLGKLLEALCAASFHGCRMLVVETKDLVLQLSKNEYLSACHVDTDGERFGMLEHWCELIEFTGFSNLVVYISSEKCFFSICAKRCNTQRIDTRSAICWLQESAGLGFLFDDQHGVFRIQISRSLALNAEDPWHSGLQHLLSSVSTVFPARPTSDEN